MNSTRRVMRPPRPHVMAIVNPKGGSGKTTLAVNLGVAFAQRGLSTCIVDTNIRQESARDWYRIRTDEEAETDSGRLHVLGADAITLSQLLPTLSADVVLIDTPGHLEARPMAQYVKLADLIVIPIQPSPPDLWAAEALVDIIHARREITDGQPQALWLVSMAHPTARMSTEIVPLLEEMGLPVAKSRTTQLIAYREAMGRGQGVIEGPFGRAAEQMTEIADELLRTTALSDLTAAERRSARLT